MPTKVKDIMLEGTGLYSLFKRVAAEAGLNLVSGSFEEGGTLSNINDVLLHIAEARYYSWGIGGTKEVPAGSTPATSGGIGAGAWVDRTDVTLRSDINIVVKRFSSVADMVDDTTLSIGQIVETLSYYDGWAATLYTPEGGNTYEIVASGTCTADGGSFITLTNGLQAKGLFGKAINASQFGTRKGTSYDSTTAIKNAIAYSTYVEISEGNYRVTSTIEIPNLHELVALGIVDIYVDHNKEAFLFTGINSGASRNKNRLFGIGFKNYSTNVPTYLVKVGASVNSAVGLNVDIESCRFIGVSAGVGISNVRGYNTCIDKCVFNSFTGTCISTLNSYNDSPNWTYALTIQATDMTNITGSALDIQSGDVFVYGGVVEGCSASAVKIHTNNEYTNYSKVSFFGTYFENNAIAHVESMNSNGVVNCSFHGCKFTSGLAGVSNIIARNASMLFDACMTPNNTILFSGLGSYITLVNCSYIYKPTSVVSRLVVKDYTYQTNTPTTAVTLTNQINVNASYGGGGALVLCSHQNSSGNATNTELFLIRYGNDGNNFSALSLGRSAGSDTSTYTFAVDSSGYLTVTSSGAGNARYMVLANMCGYSNPM